ncbi:Transcription initiation protein spt3 [Savitreella phatthalungensis]
MAAQQYRSEISQMMFVIGDSEPSAETTALIEEIVRAQVIELLTHAAAQAAKRGTKSITTEDLIFLIRHDRAKVNRLRTYLSWKDVRKNAKETEGGGADGVDLLEDAAVGGGPGGGPGGSGAPADAAAARLKYRKAKVGLPWDLNNMFPEQVPEREEEEDEEEIEANAATMERLKNADDRTKDMSKDEYVHWSECRQASFTYRKSKRFREWCHMSQLLDSKPGDDIIDILGFLTFEIVAVATEEALRIKAKEDESQESRRRAESDGGNKRRKTDCTLFEGPDEGQTPLEVRHIEEAFRRLQQPTRQASCLRNFRNTRYKRPLTLI